MELLQTPLTEITDGQPSDFRVPCANYTDSLWWDEKIDGQLELPGDMQHRHSLAKSICGTCPVKTACLTAGVEGNESGVWGGELLREGTISNLTCRVCDRPLVGKQSIACSPACSGKLSTRWAS